MLFPTPSVLSATFAHTSLPISQQQPRSSPPRKDISHLFPSWDITEDAKNKAAQLSDAATKELAKASEVAQQKAGRIELYSGKYYAAW
jgi:solute carrier family 25 phosphate transporter 3